MIALSGNIKPPGAYDPTVSQIHKRAKPCAYQVFVSSYQYCVKILFIQQKVTHPLGDDNVDLVNGQLHFLHFALNQRHLIRQTIVLHNLTCLNNDI